jgi:hypothetical protein
MIRTLRFRWLLGIILTLSSAFVTAQEQEAEKPVGLYDDNRWGVVFNTDDITLDLESYQGGVGIKWLRRTWGIRSVMDLFYSSESKTFSSILGGTLEYHLATGLVSPYLGAYLSSGVTTQRTEIDDENWTEFLTIPTSAGALFGAEVWVFDFLSAFVEYSLGLELVFDKTTESVGGDRSSESEWDYLIGTGLGNEGRIGLVVYFPPKPPEGYFGRR